MKIKHTEATVMNLTSNKSLMVMMVVAIFMIGAGVVYVAFGGSTGSLAIGGNDIKEGASLSSMTCPNTGQEILSFKVKNPLKTSSAEYLTNQSISVFMKDGTAIGSTTSASAFNTTTYYCSAGEKVQAVDYMLDQSTTVCGKQGTVDSEYTTIQSPKIGTALIRVWDYDTNTNITGWIASGNTPNVSIGTSGTKRLAIEYRVADGNVSSQYGCTGIVASVVNGNDSALNPGVVSLDSIEADATHKVSNAEALYKLNPIKFGDKDGSFDLTLSAVDSVDPGATDYTVKLYDEIEGIGKDGMTWITGINKDDSSHTDMGGANPTVTIKVV